MTRHQWDAGYTGAHATVRTCTVCRIQRWQWLDGHRVQFLGWTGKLRVTAPRCAPITKAAS